MMASVSLLDAYRDSVERTSAAETAMASSAQSLNGEEARPSRVDSKGGILISKDGYRQKIEGILTVFVYIDFLCPVCGQLHRALDAELIRMMDAGQINVDLHMINFGDTARWSSDDGYSGRSASMAYELSDLDDDPAHPFAFIRNLYDDDFQPEEGSAYVSVDNDELVEQALEAGVSRAIASKLTADRYSRWLTVINGRTVSNKVLFGPRDRFGSPTIVINGRYWNMGKTVRSVEEVPQALLKVIGLDEHHVGDADVLPEPGEFSAFG